MLIPNDIVISAKEKLGQEDIRNKVIEGDNEFQEVKRKMKG